MLVLVNCLRLIRPKVSFIVSVSFRFLLQISISQVTLFQVLILDSRFLIPDFGFQIPDPFATIRHMSDDLLFINMMILLLSLNYFSRNKASNSKIFNMIPC